MANYDIHQYAANKTYDNRLPSDDEVIAPFVVTKGQINFEHFDKDNLRTWTLRGGRKVLVAFLTCKEEEFENTMKIFNYMADAKNEHHPEDAMSLDKMEDDLNDPEANSKIPDEATVPSPEAVLATRPAFEDIVKDVFRENAMSGMILSMIAEQINQTGRLNRGEIIEQLGLGKSQGYAKIKTALAMASKYYKEYL